MASAGIQITVTMDRDVEQALQNIDKFVRAVALDKGLKTIGNKVKSKARRLVQQPGSPGYTKRQGERKNRKHLRDTLTTKVKDYQYRYKVLIVGPAYPAGASGHLVERGHRTVARTKGGTFAESQSTGTLARLAGSKAKSAPKSKIGKTGMGIHKGFAEPHPFLGPAVAEVQPHAQTILIDELKKAAT